MAHKRKKGSRILGRPIAAPAGQLAEVTSSGRGGARRGLRHLAVATTIVVMIGAVALAAYRWHSGDSRLFAASAATSVAVPTIPGAQYVGGSACTACHEKQQAAWHRSDHDLAMQVADEASVLGNFANAKFAYASTVSTFSRRDGKFIVNTDGPDGKLADFEIKYTFGVHPLQQYLVEFPGGRMQALSIAWDSRARIRADNDGSTCIPGRTSRQAIGCTGPPAARTGTSPVPSVIRPTCGRTSTPRRIRTRRRGQN